MSTYSDASLIFYPSGYKESKLYSLKPTDGSGDLTFTRASSATRVNAEGLIEGERTNYQIYSQDFTNATYIKDAGVTVSSTNNLSPSGVLDATKISVTNSGRIYSNIASNTWCSSVFLKAGTFAYFELAGRKIDLNLGTMVGGTVEDYGNGWYRVTAILTTIRPFQIVAYPNSSYTSHTTSGDYFIWGVQLELNAASSSLYIPTTTTAVSVGITNNVPRIDYTGGGCGKLLLEPQRTNLLTQSENLSTAAWAKVNLTVSLSSVLSPNGTTFAYKLTNDAIVGNHFTRNTITVSSGLSYTLSCFIKKGTRSIVTIADGFNTNELATFDLINVTATNRNTGTNSTIASYNNDWYKCSVSIFVASTSLGFMLFSGNTYAGGDTSGDFYAWGCQIEQGSYPTSYIPTTTTAVTRVADASTLINVYTNNFITASGGTWFVHILDNTVKNRDLANAAISIGDASTFSSLSNGFALANTSGTPNRLRVISEIASVKKSTLTTSDEIKVAFAWNGSTYKIYENGLLIDSDAFAFTNMDFLTMQGADVQKIIQSQILFPTALSDDDLTLLTGTLGETYFESYALMANYLNYTIQ